MEASQITPPQGPQVGDKGLKKDALGFVSSLVIGVASTAPGYSLAATLGFIVAVTGIGLQAPAVLLVSFIPMLLIAAAYYYMNRADPDCGTTFSWVTRAMGPSLGWLGGWAIIVADIIVMAEPRADRGRSTRSCSFDWHDRRRLGRRGHRASASCWIAIMTRITTIGIELSARTQVGLLGAEIITLRALRGRRTRQGRVGDAGRLDRPEPSWLNPFAIDSFDALVAGVLLAVFIYWGWDSTVTVNEESRDSSEGPGKAALLATVILLGIYMVVAVRRAGLRRPAGARSTTPTTCSACSARRCSGVPLDKILIIAVLTSAAASTQTTILPTARTSLSMARAKAMPAVLRRGAPALPDAARVDDPHGRRCRSSGTSA